MTRLPIPGQRLPDAPARDHFHAVVVNNKLYLASGRRSRFGGSGGTIGDTEAVVDVYDFATGQWLSGNNLPDNIPTQRGGASVAVLGAEIIVIGGEKTTESLLKTEALNPSTGTWRTLANLNVTGRHGTQAVVYNNDIYLPAGAKTAGGNEILPTENYLEAFSFDGPPTTPPANSGLISLEAECATVGSGWTVGSDNTASGGAYVVFSNGTTYSPPADIPANRVRFSFNASAAGSYNLFARVKAPTSSDDSFYFRVNGGSWLAWSSGIKIGNSFQWNRFGTLLNLVSGNNTLDIAYREDGLQLDKIILNTQNQTPANFGEAASNCSGTPSNQAPVAVAQASPNAGVAPLTVNLNGSQSSDDKGIVSYQWTWTENGVAKSASGVNPSITLPAGTFTISLQVTDAEGLSDTETVSISVNQPSSGSGLISLEAECATVGSGWTVGSDNTASGGAYVVFSNGTTYSPP
ncbi:MAG: PKD domain-containing protein, partial [Bacteroidia bacterium]|nr:PKD domain-containing protein [Bacteroidia bacterium]